MAPVEKPKPRYAVAITAKAEGLLPPDWTTELQPGRPEFRGWILCVYAPQTRLRGKIGITAEAEEDCGSDELATRLGESGLVEHVRDQPQADALRLYVLPHPQLTHAHAWQDDL